MSTRITIDQTATGWHVEVTDGEQVIVETDGANCNVSVQPDTDDSPTPLAVTLA